jgi:hypothetical protein
MDLFLAIAAGALLVAIGVRAFATNVPRKQILNEALGPLAVLLAVLPRRSPYSAVSAVGLVAIAGWVLWIVLRAARERSKKSTRSG